MAKAAMTVVDLLRRHVDTRGDLNALEYLDRSVTYKALDQSTSQVANALTGAGLEKGDRVAYLGKNSDRYFEALLGALKAGMPIVSINWRLSPREVQFIIDETRPRLIFVDAEFADAVINSKHSMQVVTIDPDQEVDEFVGWYSGHAMVKDTSDLTADDLAILMFTSGTTGLPKGAMLSHRALLSRFEKIETEQRPDDRFLLWMPVCHLGGTTIGLKILYDGACSIVLREFSPQLILDEIQVRRITRIILVPSAIRQILELPGCADADFSTLKLIGYGASAIPPSLLSQAMKVFGAQFEQGYGCTELTGAVTKLTTEDHASGRSELLLSAGKPFAGIELSIQDDAGNFLPAGDKGEICVRSPTVMTGYWENETATREALRDGWYLTGDVGYLDDEGYLYISDRKKDMIISGGENVYPVEVENVLMEHPDISSAAVVGVPDDKWGETVAAFIVLHEADTLTESEINAFCRKSLAGYKLPRKVFFIDALPLNSTGKVQKQVLREPFWSDQSRRVG